MRNYVKLTMADGTRWLHPADTIRLLPVSETTLWRWERIGALRVIRRRDGVWACVDDVVLLLSTPPDPNIPRTPLATRQTSARATKRLNDISSLTADHEFEPWTSRDIEFLIRMRDYPTANVARALGRTVLAVRAMRQNVLGHARTVYSKDALEARLRPVFG